MENSKMQIRTRKCLVLEEIRRSSDTVYFKISQQSHRGEGFSDDVTGETRLKDFRVTITTKKLFSSKIQQDCHIISAYYPEVRMEPENKFIFFVRGDDEDRDEMELSCDSNTYNKICDIVAEYNEANKGEFVPSGTRCYFESKRKNVIGGCYNNFSVICRNRLYTEIQDLYTK